MLNEKSYIYMILNNINGKYYIGSTKDFDNRVSGHISKLRKQEHDNIYLQRAWNKYGEDNFEFIILKKVSRKNQFKEEQKYLDKLQPFKDKGYNISRSAINGFDCEITKTCIFCKQEFKTNKPSQKYCDYCRNYQDNYYKQLEKEGIVKLVGGQYKFVR